MNLNDKINNMMGNGKVKKPGFKTGQSWLDRRGKIVQITVRDDGRISTDDSPGMLEAHGHFYPEGSKLTSPFDLAAQVLRVFIPSATCLIDPPAAEYLGRGCVVVYASVKEDMYEARRENIERLMGCEMIVFVPGWQVVAGMWLYHGIAESLNLARVTPVERT